jgi:phage/plasmid-like protein (TIGR03299 family)
MAHELNFRQDGTAEMFSLRKSPWHGLGKIIDFELNDSQVAETAGLNWNVLEKPVYHETNGIFDAIKGEKCLVREDTQQVLSVVSKEYRVFQNKETIELMRKIAGETGKIIWETAGVLSNSKTIWVLGKLPELEIKLRGDDKTESYMLITNGHGNARSLQVLPTTTRVVCMNTLSMATSGGQKSRRQNMENRKFDKASLSKGYGIHHDGNLDRSVQEIVEAYEMFQKSKVVTEEIYNQMADTKADKEMTIAYWNKVFGMPVLDDLDEKTRAKAIESTRERTNRLESILSSPTCTTEAAKDSVYGLLQSATEFVDHYSLKRKANSTSLLSHTQFGGTGAKLKEKAFDEALALVTA